MKQILFGMTAVACLAAFPLEAQKARRTTVAHASSPADQPAPAPTTPSQYAPPIYYQNGNVPVAAPFLVLSDGSILADFGGGYERVLRSCAPAQAPVQANVNGRDALGRILPPPGIAALQQGSRGQIYGQVPARSVGACYRLDGQGRAEVMRR